jgi:hypothetical protein
LLLNLHRLTPVEQEERWRDGELDVAVVRYPLSSVGFDSGPCFRSDWGGAGLVKTVANHLEPKLT